MKKQFIVIGYGDVGRRIAGVLKNANQSFVVVDRNEAKMKDRGFDYVAGDATDEEVLRRAGLNNASTVIIVLNNDDDIIFTTLISRNVNPDSIILARANATKSIEKMYRAGADYVASLSIVSGQMLARIALDHDENTMMMLEGLELGRFKVTAGSPVAGKSIAEAKIRSDIGCTIVGIEENGKSTNEIDPSKILKEGMTLAILGNCRQISRLKEEYFKDE